jgi:hypothetical protein
MPVILMIYTITPTVHAMIWEFMAALMVMIGREVIKH